MYLVVCTVASSIFLLELLIKNYFRLFYAYQSLPIIKGYLNFTVVFNTGAAFSILRNSRLLLIVIGLLFICFFIFFIKKEATKNKFVLILYGLILGGAVSNLSERIFLGYVVDYIDLRIAGKNIWPIFNLADSSICLGVFFLFLHSFFSKKKD